MIRVRTLPLGVDIGSARLRIARAVRDGEDGARIEAVAARDVPEGGDALIPALIEEMLNELGTRERRCVAAIGAPAAVLRVVRFPNMSGIERARAARFEARRIVDWDVETEASTITCVPFRAHEQLYAVGVVRRADVVQRVRLLRRSGLRVVAIDQDALALQRALPDYDTIVDIGLQRTSVHIYEADAPRTFVLSQGGADLTRRLAHDLAIDLTSAEKRKRIVGSAGASHPSSSELVAQLSSAIRPAAPGTGVQRVALTGNGCRVPGFGPALAAAIGGTVDVPVSDALRRSAYPADVLRAAAPDWTLAAGCAMWGLE